MEERHLKEGTRISFDDGFIVGVGIIRGITLDDLYKLGCQYIVEIEKIISKNKEKNLSVRYDYSTILIWECQIVNVEESQDVKTQRDIENLMGKVKEQFPINSVVISVKSGKFVGVVCEHLIDHEAKTIRLKCKTELSGYVTDTQTVDYKNAVLYTK